MFSTVGLYALYLYAWDRFTLADGIMRIEQDGNTLGSATLSASVASAPESARHSDTIDWGQGAYGVFTGGHVGGSTVSR